MFHYLALNLHTGQQLNWSRVTELARTAAKTEIERRDSSDVMLGQLAEKLKALQAEQQRKEQEKHDNLQQLAKLKLTLAEEERQMREWVCTQQRQSYCIPPPLYHLTPPSAPLPQQAYNIHPFRHAINMESDSIYALTLAHSVTERPPEACAASGAHVPEVDRATERCRRRH